MEMFTTWFLILYASLYGITMKLADLFDEHNMKWFKGDAFIFGLLWGSFGILLILSRIDIANIILAQMIAYIVRLRLDHLNHAIAATMIIITFILKSQLNLTLFLTFLIIFIVFGGLRDYFGNIRKKKDWLYKINEPALYYIIPTFIYSLITGVWIVFFVFTVYRISYNIVKYRLFKKGYYTIL